MTVEEPRVKVQREPRRQLNHHAAWVTVDDGVTRRECTYWMFSPGGARIVMDVPIDIRDRFVLALVPSHPKRQQCEVVWRRGEDLWRQILGVTFRAPARRGRITSRQVCCSPRMRRIAMRGVSHGSQQSGV